MSRTPGARAVVDEDLTLTYEQLNAYSNSIAMVLHERGLGAEDTVCVCMPRCTLWVATLLGVLRAGTYLLM